MTDDLSSPRGSPFLSLSVSPCRLLNGYIRSSVTASEKLRRYFPNILTYSLARSPSNLLYRTHLVGPSHPRNVLMVFLTHRSSRYFQRLGDMGCTFQSETSSLEHLTLSFWASRQFRPLAGTPKPFARYSRQLRQLAHRVTRKFYPTQMRIILTSS